MKLATKPFIDNVLVYETDINVSDSEFRAQFLKMSTSRKDMLSLGDLLSPDSGIKDYAFRISVRNALRKMRKDMMRAEEIRLAELISNSVPNESLGCDCYQSIFAEGSGLTVPSKCGCRRNYIDNFLEGYGLVSLEKRIT